MGRRSVTTGLLCLLAAGMLTAGCRGDAAPGSVADLPATGAETAIVVPLATRAPAPAFATATPWPTFTPKPTVGPLLLPTGVAAVASVVQPTPTDVPPTQSVSATVTPTPPATATPTPLPTIDASVLDADRYLATPTPPPFQLSVPGTDVRVVRQTVFMSHYAEGPDFWPTSSTVFYARTARFIGWRVQLDYADAGAGFEMTGLMRWLNISTGEHVIYQTPYTMTGGQDLFFMIGKPVPGFWSPGRYRVELWDNRDRVAVYYEFEVRSGVI